MTQKVKGKRTLKNGAIAGYVKQKDGKYLWRIIGHTKKQKGGWGASPKISFTGGKKQSGGWGMVSLDILQGNKNKNQKGGWGSYVPPKTK